MAMRRRMKAKKSMRKMRRRSMKKAMKSMRRRKAMRVSKIGKRRSVFSGKKSKTRGGLTRAHLKKNKAGKIVSRKASDRARKSRGFKKVMAWAAAVKAARKAMGVKGFQAVG